jgi:hypothetical protein
VSFADGKSEKSEGKRSVRGRFFGSNRAKKAGFGAKRGDFSRFMFTG